MNPVMLNFLKEAPDTNWYDYFLNRAGFKEILTKEPLNRKLLATLCDQFVDQVFTTCTDIRQAKKKRLDENDVKYAEGKRESLWRCAWACLAAIGWDLEFLLEHSTVTKVYNLLSRLFECSMKVKMQSDFLGCLSKKEITLDSSNFFIAWICVRFIVLVDMRARKPKPSVKPTVSNPNILPDPALNTAKKIAAFTRTVRQNASHAAKFLEIMLKLNLKNVQVPCFASFKIDKSGANVDIDLNASFKTISWGMMKARMESDLLRAHFAALHLQKAKIIFQKLSENKDLPQLTTDDSFLRPCFRFEKTDLEGIQNALYNNKLPNLNPNEYDITPKLLKPLPSKIIKPGENVLMTRPNQKALTPELRRLLPLPSCEEFNEYAYCGPCLWNMLHCYDFERLVPLSVEYKKTYQREFVDPKQGKMSPIIAEIVEKEKFYYHVTLYFFSQLERLIQNKDLRSWFQHTNTFSVIVQNSNHSIRSLWNRFIYEILRSNITIWDTLSLKHTDGAAFRDFSNNLKVQTTNSIHKPEELLPATDWGLNKLSPLYFLFFLNRNLNDALMSTNLPIQNAFFNFARLLITVTTSNPPKMENLLWKFFSMIMSKDAVAHTPSREGVLTKDQFYAFVVGFRNPKLIKHLFTFTIPIFNKVVTKFERERLPYADAKARNNFVYMDKTIRDMRRKTMPDDFPQLEHIDFDYLGKVVIKLLQNAVEVSAQDPSLRRQLGDAYYAMKQHDKALLEYAEVLLIHQQKITRKEKKEYLNDSFYSKIVHCLYQKKLLTLACLTGQLNKDKTRHLILLPGLVQDLFKTHDAGASYFPYLYDLRLMEALSTLFYKHGHHHLLGQMVKVTPSKALNKANVTQIRKREVLKRRKGFIGILYRTIKSTCKS